MTLKQLPCFVVVLLLAPSVAWGHAGDLLESLDVRPPQTDDPGVVIESSIGMLWAENGQDYRWICHEAVTQPETLLTPRYLRSPAGYTLAVVPREGEGREDGEGLYRSTDHCNWTPVAGMSGQVVEDVAMDLDVPQTVYAITNTPDSSTGNGVWVSVDGGVQWSMTALGDSEHHQSSVLVGDGLVWSTSVDFSAQKGWLHRSSDNGGSWDHWEVDLTGYPSPPDLRLLALHDDGVWFRTTQTLQDDLWTLELSAGAPERLAASNTKIMSATRLDDGRLFMALFNQGIAEFREGAFLLIPDSPSSYAVRSDGQSLFAATRVLDSGQGLMISADGLVFEDAFRYGNLGPPPTCAADSHSAQFCEPLWTDLEQRLAPELRDTGDIGEGFEGEPNATEPQEESGCWGSKRGQAGLLVVLPLMGWRRRGKRTPGDTTPGA